MLLQLSARQLVDNPTSTIIIRSCTLGGSVSAADTLSSSEELDDVENPKKSGDLLLAGLDVAPACTINGTQVSDTPTVSQAGLDMALTAAETINYVYSKDEDPAGAFEWWLSPCGGTDLVPDDIKKAFGILSKVAGGVSSFVEPKNIKKNSGKKGDEGNPTDRAAPRKPRPKKPANPNNGGVTKPKKQKATTRCTISRGKAT